MSKKHTPTKQLSPKQKLVFKLVMISIPVLIFLLPEVLLRISGYGSDFSLFIDNPTEGYEEYLIVNPEVGKKYFQKFEYTAPANDIFLKDKLEGTFRIFVMGSSTVYGFPFDRNLMFSRILHKKLEQAYPTKHIEVINTSITAINSFTLLDYTDQILEQQPDAVLIYAGHNEFYGAFGVGSNETMGKSRKLTQIHIKLMSLKLYQLFRNTITGIAKNIAENSKNKVHGTLMKRIVRNKDIIYESKDYKLAMTHYEENMNDLLSKIKEQNIPVFYSDMVSNIKDLKPFNTNVEGANEDALNAYLKAKKAISTGDYNGASNAYYQAKDFDGIRFRASEDLNEIIYNLVEEFGATQVNMLDEFKKASSHGLIGNNLMTEHVHPNINGNFLMAETFFQSILTSELIGAADTEKIYNVDYFRRNWGYTTLDSILAVHKVRQLKNHWPFVENAKEYDYRNTYRPTSYIDSIAFSIMKFPDVSIADARIDLAEKYNQNKQYLKAFKEYNALLCINPNLALNYRDAAKMLVKMGDIPLALKYFKQSLKYEETFFATFKVGELYLIKADYESAIRYFKKAYALAPQNKKLNVLNKTYLAFAYSYKNAEAKTVAQQIKKANPKANLKLPPKQYVYRKYIPLQTRNEIEMARNANAEKQYQGAIDILQKSLFVYDSHIANRYIAELYQQTEQYDLAFKYFNKVYDEFKFDPVFLHQLIMLDQIKSDKNSMKKHIDELERIEPRYPHLEQLKLLLS